MQRLRLILLLVLGLCIVQVVSAQGGTGPVNGFTGGLNATTGQSSLQATQGCPEPNNCPLAAPATWTISSSAGWTVLEPVPTSNFSFLMPIVGHQVVNIRACNQLNCYSEDKEIGVLDSSLILVGTDDPVVPGQPYELAFEARTDVIGGGGGNIDMYFDVDFPYAGSQLPQLYLAEGLVVSCERQVSNGMYSLACNTIIPRNTSVDGFVQVPADHAQMFYFNTNWRFEHNYYQPGTEIEYPYDELNTPSAFYGGDAVFLPFMNR